MVKSVEKNEVLPLTLLFIHSFLNGLALVYFEATANTLFLMNYDTSDLPYIYILASIVSVVIGYFYTVLENNLNIKKLLSITLFLILLIVIFFFVSITVFKIKALYMWIMVFKDVLWIFVGIEFGILTGMIFNIRQGKRLFGLLVSGEIIAGIIGGLSIGFIIELTDTINLLVISALALVVSFLLLLKILNEFSDRFKEEAENSEDNTEPISYKEILKNRYYVLFFALSVLSFFVFYFIDYIFYYEVENHFKSEKEMASFFGIFFALLNIVNLCSSLFVSGAVLSRFGIIFGLLAIPLMSIFGVGLVLLLSSVSLIFIVIIAIKLLNEVIDISILNPTFKVLYQPIPVEDRVKVLAFRETIIEPVAMGLVGIILLFFTSFSGIELILYLIILFSALWLYYAKELKNEYVKSLENVVGKRKYFTDEILYSGVSNDLLLKGLSSENEIEILYYLNLLEKFNYNDLDEVILKLISHESMRVRKASLEKLNKFNLIESLDILNKRLEVEKDDEVFKLLLITYSKIGTKTVQKTVLKYIDNENGLIQEGAIIGLHKYCGSDARNIAVSVLEGLFNSVDTDEQIKALNILEEIGIDEFDDSFSKCLKSDNFEIRKLAIEIVAKLKLENFIPIIYESINNPKYRKITVFCLSEFGDTILTTIKNIFNDTNNLQNKITLIEILGHMKSESANEFLFDLVSEPLLTDSVLKALFKADYTVENEDKLYSLLEFVIKDILSDLLVLQSFNTKKYANTYLVFKELVDIKINNIFLILGFKYSKKTLSQVKNFTNTSNDVKAYTIELIDNLLPIKLNSIVLPILDDGTISKKLSKYNNDFKPNEMSQEDFFKLINNSDEFLPIVKISLLYEIGKNKDSHYNALVESNLKSSDEIISETASWAMHELKEKV